MARKCIRKNATFPSCYHAKFNEKVISIQNYKCYFGVPTQKDVLKISCKSSVSNVMANATVLNYAAACFK